MKTKILFFILSSLLLSGCTTVESNNSQLIISSGENWNYQQQIEISPSNFHLYGDSIANSLNELRIRCSENGIHFFWEQKQPNDWGNIPYSITGKGTGYDLFNKFIEGLQIQNQIISGEPVIIVSGDPNLGLEAVRSTFSVIGGNIISSNGYQQNKTSVTWTNFSDIQVIMEPPSFSFFAYFLGILGGLLVFFSIGNQFHWFRTKTDVPYVSSTISDTNHSTDQFLSDQNYCLNCGEPYTNNSKYCGKCGNPKRVDIPKFGHPDPPRYIPKSNMTPSWFFVVIGVAVIGLLIIIVKPGGSITTGEFPEKTNTLPNQEGELNTYAVVPTVIQPTQAEILVAVPTISPTVFQCPGMPPSLVKVGDKVEICSEERLILRQEPSSHAPDIRRFEPGTEFELIGGPVCADDFTWWQAKFRHNNTYYIGWVREGTEPEETYFICVVK